MSQSLSLSAVVTAQPPSIHEPQLPPGDSPLNFVIRNFPDRWKNLVSAATSSLVIDPSVRQQLLSQKVKMREIHDEQLTERITTFFSRHWPTEYRTLEGLSEVRKFMRDAPDDPQRLELCQILFLHDDSDNDADRDLVSKFGVETIPSGPLGDDDISLAEILARVKGQYLWFVPGGSLINQIVVTLKLAQVLSVVGNDPSSAGLDDGGYSAIYRVSSLVSLAPAILNIKPISNISLAKALEGNGFVMKRVTIPGFRLTKFEQIYGGIAGAGETEPPEKSKSWLARWLGR